jgi:hypothetical protein
LEKILILEHGTLECRDFVAAMAGAPIVSAVVLRSTEKAPGSGECALIYRGGETIEWKAAS